MTAGDYGAALAALVELWRAMPDPVLATAIAVLGPVAGREAPRPSDDKAWLAQAATDDAVAREGLYATVFDHKWQKRLAALCAYPDPRTAELLTGRLAREDLATEKRFASESRALFAALTTQGDPRTLPRLGEIDQAWRLNGGTQAHGQARGEAYRAIIAATDALTARTSLTLPPVLAAAVASLARDPRLVAAVEEDATRDAELRAAVYADPASDVPRAVYADWLQQRGDPRGELIALQLAGGRENEERARALAEARAVEWLGTLAPYVRSVNAYAYRRGFPAVLSLEDKPLPEDPAWATVEEAHHALPPHPLPVLRTLRWLSSKGLAELAARAAPPPVETLEIRGNYQDGDDLAAIERTLRGMRLTTLRRLELAGVTVSPAIFDTLLATGPLESLEVEGRWDELDGWLRTVGASRLPTLDLRTYRGPHVTLSRGADGRISVVTTMWFSELRTEGDLDVLTGVLDRIEPGAITELTLATSKRGVRPKERERFERALGRHPDLRASLKPR